MKVLIAIILGLIICLPLILALKTDTCKQCTSKNTKLDGYYVMRSPGEGSYNGSNYKFICTGYKCHNSHYKHKKLIRF